jgi:hypothetical protein
MRITIGRKIFALATRPLVLMGFTSLSEGLTPSGLVNVINHYLTTSTARTSS